VIGICKENGLIIGKNGTTVAGYNNVLTLSPPLNIEDEDLSFLINTLTDALWKIQ
jgi:taurine-pyruvate aminotransferase